MTDNINKNQANNVLVDNHIGIWQDYNNECDVKAYEIHFIQGFNGADIYIGLEFEYVKIICQSRRSVSAPGFDNSGCIYYDFPMTESLDYINVVAFIRERTYLRNKFCGNLISREEYESILSDIGYTE